MGLMAAGSHYLLAAIYSYVFDTFNGEEAMQFERVREL